MNIMDICLEASRALLRGVQLTDGVQLTTQCMYPSNSLVHVVIRGAGASYVVSDQGGAVQEVAAAGGDASLADRKFRQLVERQGLNIRSGVIYSPVVSPQELPAAIALIANTSKEVADRLFDQIKLKRDRNFKAMLRHLLKETYSDKAVRETPIVGASNKAHKFENVIQLVSGQRITFDPVTKEPGSVAARVLANLDVQAAKHPNLEQRIVYDDIEDWQAADLNILLMSNTTLVPFSRVSDVLPRLTA
jgi:hypothetical protein